VNCLVLDATPYKLDGLAKGDFEVVQVRVCALLRCTMDSVRLGRFHLDTISSTLEHIDGAISVMLKAMMATIRTIRYQP
jgi:hypothetical protein